MSVPKGGQRRTLITICGKVFSGSVREANGKMKIHTKYCETCKSENNSLPEFDNKVAEENGWKGISYNHELIKKTVVFGLEKDTDNYVKVEVNKTLTAIVNECVEDKKN